MTAVPSGAEDEESLVAVSWPHTACCASSEKSATCQGCTPSTEEIQPVEPSAEAISLTAVKKSTGSLSRPSKRLGWSTRKNPVSSSALTDDSGTRSEERRVGNKCVDTW